MYVPGGLCIDDMGEVSDVEDTDGEDEAIFGNFLYDLEISCRNYLV